MHSSREKLDFPQGYPKRRFRMWAYVPSHSRLLIRSGRETSGTTRIDIAFGDVSAVSLPVTMDGLIIDSPSRRQLRDLAPLIGFEPIREHVMIVAGKSYRGYVVASFLGVDESNRAFHEPDKWGILSPS